MQNQKPANKLSKYSFLIIVAASIMILAFAMRNPMGQEQQKVSYSDFLTKVETRQIAKVVISNSTGKITGELSDGKKFITDAPRDENLIKALRDNKIAFSAENPGLKEGIGSSLVMMILPVGVILALWFLIMRQASVGGSQAMNFGRSRAKLLNDNQPRTTFDDVAGVDEAKEELKEIVDFLKDPKKFQLLGAKIPRGVLLVGPPGSGKTLLARAVAGEAKVSFYHMSGSDFVEMFVGVGASRVRDLFEQAKKSAPCLVFMDEIDAVGRQRGAGLGGGHDEREQTLNQLLVEMDGFDPNSGVILLAATNRPDVLDPALLRPGRFDRQVVVDEPDVKGREEILKVHARGKPIDQAVNLGMIARRTPGFTGADLSNVLNEAAILAARGNCTLITTAHIEDAIERVIAGPERKSRLMSDHERRITACHEAGHALVAKLSDGSDPVHKISILPRGRALGYTLQLPIEDKYLQTRKDLLHRIRVLLGGRVAEKIVFDEITTGASNDIERASKIARRMVCEFGMSDELGPIAFGHKQETVFLGRDFSNERNYSEDVASRIDAEIQKLITDAYNAVSDLINEHRDRLDLITEELIAHETLDGARLEALLDGLKLSDEEIAQKESEYRKVMEEKNLADAMTFAPPVDKSAIDSPIPPAAEQSAAASITEAKTSSAAGLFGQFCKLLTTTFDDTFAPILRSSKGDSALTQIEQAISESDSDTPPKLVWQTLESADELTRSAVHLRLALFYVSRGYADLVAEQLIAALQNGSNKVEARVEKTLISSIGYFRIINEEIRKTRMTFYDIVSDDAIMERIDKRYQEWEKKASDSTLGVFPTEN